MSSDGPGAEHEKVLLLVVRVFVVVKDFRKKRSNCNSLNTKVQSQECLCRTPGTEATLRRLVVVIILFT